jgi:hypothetical protein
MLVVAIVVPLGQFLILSLREPSRGWVGSGSRLQRRGPAYWWLCTDAGSQGGFAVYSPDTRVLASLWCASCRNASPGQRASDGVHVALPPHVSPLPPANIDINVRRCLLQKYGLQFQLDLGSGRADQGGGERRNAAVIIGWIFRRGANDHPTVRVGKPSLHGCLPVGDWMRATGDATGKASSQVTRSTLCVAAGAGRPRR